MKRICQETTTTVISRVPITELFLHVGQLSDRILDLTGDEIVYDSDDQSGLRWANQLMQIKLVSLALLLTFLFAACTPATSDAVVDPNQHQPTTATGSGSFSEISELPTITPTPTRPAATVTSEGCYDRGYAGRTRDPNDQDIDVYWLVEPPDDPADDARAIAETLCVLGGKYVPPGNIRAGKANYTLKQLDEWYSLLSDELWQVPSLRGGSGSGANNTLRFDVVTNLGKSTILRLAEQLGIPSNAVEVRVETQIEFDNPEVNPADGGMELTVDYPDEIISGRPVTFSATVTNTTDQEHEINYNGAFPADIAILDSENRQVWHYLTGAIIQPGGSTLLKPGESVVFEVVWEGLDLNDIVPPAGDYWVRSFVNFGFENSSDRGRYQLRTPPQPVRINGK